MLVSTYGPPLRSLPGLALSISAHKETHDPDRASFACDFPGCGKEYFKTFLKKGAFKVQILNDSETPRSQVLEADVVMISYDFMRKQHTAAKWKIWIVNGSVSL